MRPRAVRGLGLTADGWPQMQTFPGLVQDRQSADYQPQFGQPPIQELRLSQLTVSCCQNDTPCSSGWATMKEIKGSWSGEVFSFLLLGTLNHMTGSLEGEALWLCSPPPLAGATSQVIVSLGALPDPSAIWSPELTVN